MHTHACMFPHINGTLSPTVCVVKGSMQVHTPEPAPHPYCLSAMPVYLYPYGVRTFYLLYASTCTTPIRGRPKSSREDSSHLGDPVVYRPAPFWQNWLPPVDSESSMQPSILGTHTCTRTLLRPYVYHAHTLSTVCRQPYTAHTFCTVSPYYTHIHICCTIIEQQLCYDAYHTYPYNTRNKPQEGHLK